MCMHLFYFKFPNIIDEEKKEEKEKRITEAEERPYCLDIMISGSIPVICFHSFLVPIASWFGQHSEIA